MLWYLGEEKKELEYQERIIKEEIINKAHVQILNTLEWKIPIERFEVTLTTATLTRIDALKKMIMRLLLTEPIEAEELTEFLKVDPLFIKDVLEYLERSGLAILLGRKLELTELGRKQYEAGTILSKPVNEKIEFDYSPANDTVIPKEEKNDFLKFDWELEEYRYRQKSIDLHGKELEENALREIIGESKAVFEKGGKEKIISAISPINRLNVKYAKCIEFQLYDVLEDKAYSRVWNGAVGSWDRSFEQKIDKQESEQWKMEYIQAISERFPERYEQVKKKIGILNVNGPKEAKVNIIRGEAIRQRFDKSFKDTRKKMLMVSPWVSGTVVDREMLKTFESFAAGNKTMYISWGIAKDLFKETRRPSEQLLDRIRSIKHKDGTQAIFIRWFGNQHNKEIIIDNHTLLLGSYNWLSYRGDYDLRQESVLEVNDTNIINGTIEFIEKNFVLALEQELQLMLLETLEQVDSVVYKNWMKELILLNSFLEKRKQLSNELLKNLYEIGRNKTVNELASMWVVYAAEEFGVAEHLSRLITQQQEAEAEAYYDLCRKHLSAFDYLKNSPVLSPHAEWLEKKEENKKRKEKPSNGTRKKKK